jgi:hypothetical protein
MTKEVFLQDLEEIITDSLFIGAIDEEISNNLWRISLSSELARAVTLEDISIFIERVIANRKEQVRIISPAKKMLFYLWFDEQASQIRFNIISDDGTALPFGCKVVLAKCYTPIVTDFLHHPYHDGIPIVPDANVDEYCEEDYALKVYCTGL